MRAATAIAMIRMMILTTQTTQMMMKGALTLCLHIFISVFFYVYNFQNFLFFYKISSTENSENEEEDEASDVEQKKHSPNSDSKSRKSNLTEEDNDSVLKLNEAAEKLEKMLAIDLNADDLTEQKNAAASCGSGSNEHTRQSPKNSDKMDSGGNRTFGMQQQQQQQQPPRTDNNSRATDSNLPSKDKTISRPQLIDDNHSNISDSDIGDFPDDLDDSSNDSVKSSNSHSFMPRVPQKSNDVPMKSDSEAALKSELKGSNSNTELPYNFLDDLNTSDTTDSNSSTGKDGAHCANAFNLMRDCTTTTTASTTSMSTSLMTKHEPSSSSSSTSLTKTSPITDNTKLKSVSSSIGLSLDSAIGSKSVEDDNAMSDLHTDNISDDEYDDIKPDNLTARKTENVSMRKNDNFENISKYIGPAPISLNTLISADYSNLSDNNDTSSNDNRDSNDSKRAENSPTIVKPASHDSSRITDKDIMEPGELLGKTLLEDSNLTNESLTSGENGGKSVGKISFLSDNKDKSDNLMADSVDLIDSTKKTSDSFGLTAAGSGVDAIGSNTDFSSLHAIKAKESGSNDGGGGSGGGGDTTDVTKANNTNSSSSNSANSNNKPDNRGAGEKPTKTDNEIYELNFLDEHSMNDSNQSGILGMIFFPFNIATIE